MSSGAPSAGNREAPGTRVDDPAGRVSGSGSAIHLLSVADALWRVGGRRAPGALVEVRQLGVRRLAARSIASTSSATAARAASSAPGSATTTVAVVPRAGQLAVVNPLANRPR